MYLYTKISFFIFFIALSLGIFFTVLAQQTDQQSLVELRAKEAIVKKNQEFADLQKKINETQVGLDQVSSQKQTLSQQVKKVEQTIKQLDYSVKANQVAIEKYGLEIDSLEIKTEELRQKIAYKQEVVRKLLRDLDQTESDDIVIPLLRNGSLSDFLSEIEIIRQARAGVENDVKDLNQYEAELLERMEEIDEKKQSVQTETEKAKARREIAKQEKASQDELLSITKNKEKNYQNILQQLYEQQLKIAEEIEAEEAKLRKDINPDEIPKARRGVLGWPVSGKTTQGYGATAFAKNGYRGKWHNGIDIGVPTGTEIVSPEDGVVVATGDQDKYCRKGAYGKFIVIRHNNNLTTLFGHLSKIGMGITAGKEVKRGELIGYVGSTGYSTGSHLHFTVYDSKTFSIGASRSCGPMPSGGDLNPLQYL